MKDPAISEIMGGDPPPDGYSCECKDGHSAGMASFDTCERYCSTDNNFGGKKSCD